MKFSIYTRSYNSYGGNKHFQIVADLLEEGTGTYGSAINEVEFTVCFYPESLPEPTLETMQEDYKQFLLALPKQRFLRKKQVFEIQYASQLSEGDYQEYYGPPRVEHIRAAFAELATHLELIEERLTSKDDFDFPAFRRECGDVLSAMPTEVEELEAVKARCARRRKAIYEAMDPWEREDIDWKKFHPNAKSLLNDVFFWSLTNDFAPHGNDTGADLLADFKKWNKKNLSSPAWMLVAKLWPGWGFAPVDGNVVEESAVQQLLKTNEMDVQVFNEAIIAAAFAAIKLRGDCDVETCRLARNAIVRERIAAAAAPEDWTHREERLATLTKIEAALKRFLPSSP